MPFHDLNVIHSSDNASLSATLAFLSELEYSVVALTTNITGKLPSPLPTTKTDDLKKSSSLKILSRLTLTVSDTSQNHRVNTLNTNYDLVALRPTNDKTFQLCCSSLDCDIISLDFTQRFPFPIKFKTVASALQRGIRFEICYSGGITGGNDARRNLISGAGALIRATRGRGIIVSSEASAALGLRAPWDVVNLATVWGLSQQRGKEAVSEEAGRVVRLAEIKRTSFRGVVDVVENGTHDIPYEEQQEAIAADSSVQTVDPVNGQSLGPTVPLPALKQVTVVPDKSPNPDKAKRKASITSLNDKASIPQGNTDGKPLSKREMKRQAKRARFDRATGKDEVQELPHQTLKKDKGKTSKFPLQHESLSTKRKS
ncbi:hypothetical protein ES702_03682 [subsurface metagenome]